MTPWTEAYQVSLSFTIPRSFLKLVFIESVTPSNHLILCCPLPPLPSIFPSIRVFSNESALHIRRPKYWSFSFSINPLGLISLISLLSKGLSRVFSSTTIQKHQFFSAQPSFGEGNDNPLQYFCLENPEDGGAWWAAVYGVAQSRTWLRWLSSSSNLPYGPALTFIHDYWKNHSFDSTDLCQQNDVSAF